MPGLGLGTGGLVTHRQAELRQDFLMGDRLVVLEPLVGLGYGLTLGIAQGAAVLVGRNHGLEEMNHGGELAGAELVQQLMGMLYVSGH